MAILQWLPNLLLVLAMSSEDAAVNPMATGAEGEDLDYPMSEISDMTPRDLQILFDEASTNNRTELTKAEFLAFLLKTEIDMNKEESGAPPFTDLDSDGVITEDEILKELKTWTVEPKEELKRIRKLEQDKFRAADENGDKKLSGDELAFMYSPHPFHEGVLNVLTKSEFSIRDLNKDGKLTEEELWYDHIRPEDHDPHDGEEAAERSSVFKGLDDDGDSFISFTEMKDWESGEVYLKIAVDKIFDLCDADGNQKASYQELRVAWPMIDETGVALNIAGIFESVLLKVKGPQDKGLDLSHMEGDQLEDEYAVGVHGDNQDDLYPSEDEPIDDEDAEVLQDEYMDEHEDAVMAAEVNAGGESDHGFEDL
eukprot:CAMPEP_0197657454 /NCGR_PEP_ID=MMETSP1338-20131121/44636_1 /TAXON_ID=43686 ORGANISM="Pelagodinium beii, Strain RCC1491" /NCGR_SAMPLE_ID=MMETSP1338 /ASSEMBLY_ACC=CAM_ASM_000754 /LENGTH=367 /DNA_ID=CAMNT_0043233823 /DNA_START=33 /DNA_END=1136 /DNA_ORIENTATION=-